MDGDDDERGNNEIDEGVKGVEDKLETDQDDGEVVDDNKERSPWAQKLGDEKVSSAKPSVGRILQATIFLKGIDDKLYVLPTSDEVSFTAAIQ